ncbi:MAG: hypothetical protein H7Y27_12075 [Gemmatimonadaceae bacterium]|nr:hypothetical protein [Chitinophagaceae bacterium]
MNERNTFGKLLSDKLQRLPSPDVDTSWQQMKDLLDKEDSKKVGGFRPGTGWKIGAVIAIVLTSALYFYAESRHSDSLTVTKGTEGSPAVSQTDRNKVAQSDETIGISPANQTDSHSDPLSAAKRTEESPAGTHTNRNKVAQSEKTIGISPADQSDGHSDPLSAAKRTEESPAGTHTDRNKVAQSEEKNIKTPSPKSTIGISPANQPDSHSDPLSTAKRTEESPAGTHTNRNKVAQSEKTIVISPSGRNDFNTDLAIPSDNEYTSLTLSESAKKLAVKVQRDAAIIAESKKERKQLNLADLYQPFTLKADNDNDPYWAIGLALNSVVATGSQTRSSYNVNAKSGTLSDYIPSPYVQYHFNKAVYIQTEINLSSPQHTPQLLIDRETNPNNERSVYLQKLYYFNWPFSMHYSPFKNFYLAGGVQFSSFQSGVALFQDRNLQSSAISNNVLKFKDDSLASRLSPNEWRWQTGADYYIKRFTLGMRYNRAFRDLVNYKLSPNLPVTDTRNSAFTLFLKYNLYDGRKRD